MKISCPSKTFLVGEYTILQGGPALLLATSPYFILENNVFIDPWQGAGGFGASGAKSVLSAKKAGKTDVWEVWQAHQHSTSYGSGADIVAQWMGGMTFFYPQKKIIKTLDWPFPELLIVLIQTGYKVPTHEHLQAISIEKLENKTEITQKEDSLTAIALKTYFSLINKDQENFIASLNAYADKLNSLEFTCNNTQQLLNQIRYCPYSLAAKGCGALGADVLLVIIEKTQKANFLSWALQAQLNVVFCDNQFAAGVKCQ